MRTTEVEHLLGKLQLPIPIGIKRAIEDRDKGVDPAEVVKHVQARVAKGEAFDVASRAVPQMIQTDAKTLVEVTIEQSWRGLLELKRAATLTLFKEFRELGDNVPTTAEAALYAGADLQAKFKQRQECGARYGDLYRLHGLLLVGRRNSLPDVNPTAWRWFSDTRAWPKSEGTRQPSMAFGPHDEEFAQALPIRLEFLVSHDQFWQPDSQQCNDYYLRYCGEVREPKAPVTTLSAKPVTM